MSIPGPSAIDRAIAKLDAILVAASGNAAPAAAAPAATLPTSNSAASTSTNSVPTAGKAPEGARDVLINKAQIKVARITSAAPLENSQKLLKLQADLGDGDTRQIMAGLAQFIKAEELVGRLVCVASNLKPAKLAGQPSEAMVLAAEAERPQGLLVCTLIPPEGSQPGDLVHLDGAIPPASYPKILKLDEWKKVVPGLVVAAGGKATFEGTPLVTSQGLVTIPAEVPDGAEIH